jgi:CheY-like chemotaxis protein
MSASFFRKFNSLLPRPDSYQEMASFLGKNPWVRVAARVALTMTFSVMATGAVVLVFTGKQFLVIVVSAVIVAPFVGAAMGGLIVLYLKSLGQAPTPTTAPAARNHTVLLLEANPSLLEIIKEGLTNAGFHMICALTAKQAAFLCRNHGGLMDLLLADTNALGDRPIECLQTIKGFHLDLPVLLISAYDRQTLCERHAGLLTTYEFLPMPFEFPHLTETIETLVQLQSTPIDKRQTTGA